MSFKALRWWVSFAPKAFNWSEPALKRGTANAMSRRLKDGRGYRDAPGEILVASKGVKVRTVPVRAVVSLRGLIIAPSCAHRYDVVGGRGAVGELGGWNINCPI